jgi:hypothetical protein
MTKDEKRFLRRELINRCVHSTWYDGTKYSLTTIKHFVRMGERASYGAELKVY